MMLPLFHARKPVLIGVGIGLAVAAGLLAVFLAVMSLFPTPDYSAAVKAALPPARQQQADEGTAVLFLLDESGGVSGRCKEAKPDEVLVTDAAGLRYDLVRFYLQLWRAYYSTDRWAFPDQEPSLPPLSVGVSQFAQTYRETQPLTPASELRAPENGDPLYQRLSSPVQMMAPFSDTWFCWTNYPEALEEAANALDKSGASEKILVLLSDGSTRGSEIETPDLVKREKVRQDIKGELERLSQKNIRTLVMLWGASQCNQYNNCGLTSNEWTLREGDLDKWEGWDGKLITILDELAPFRAQGRRDPNESPFAALLPGYRCAAGFLETRGTDWNKLDLESWGPAQSFRVIAVTSQNVDSEQIAVCREDRTLASHRREAPQWFQMDDRILLPNPKCQSFKWYLEVKPTTDEPGMTVYYWIVQATAEPRLAALELSPQVVILNQDQHMTATVRLKDETWPWHPECYQVTAAVSSGQIMTTTMVQQPAPFVFPFTLPPDLRWGPITVTADLAYVNKPDNKVDWRSATVQIKYLPEFPNGLTLEAIPDPGTLQKQTGEFTVSIPVPYAAVVPGLQVHFSLYPESFDAGSEKPPKSRDGCAQTNMGQAEQLAHFTSRRDEKNPNALIFDVVFPYQQLMEPKCDYYHLLIRWTDLTGDGDEAWDQIQMIKEPLPPTPAPNPTRGLIGPSILCPAVVVTLGIIAPGFWLLKRRSGARSKDSHVRKGKVQNGNSGSHIPEK